MLIEVMAGFFREVVCESRNRRHWHARLSAQVLALSVALFSSCIWAEDIAMAEVFARYGVDGTMVLVALNGGEIVAHNDQRASRRMAPASTFKILNTLIALETKAVAGADEVFKWDGRHYDIPTWNQDQTLDSAFKVSCVWCYQELARRVGAGPYRQYLPAVNYGKLTEPFELTTFWLDGGLQISAREQVDFLEKLYRRSLPFSDTSYQTLRRMMLVEATPEFSLFAKTGWAADLTPQIGWYVGYVETKRDIWLFAANIDVRGEADLPLRQRIVREVLRAKAVIECDRCQ